MDRVFGATDGDNMAFHSMDGSVRCTPGRSSLTDDNFVFTRPANRAGDGVRRVHREKDGAELSDQLESMLTDATRRSGRWRWANHATKHGTIETRQSWVDEVCARYVALPIQFSTGSRGWAGEWRRSA